MDYKWFREDRVTMMANSLVEVCRQGRYEIVKILIQKCDANVNDANYDGYTPLHAAIKYGHYHIVKFLIDEGVDVDLFGRGANESEGIRYGGKGWTPLYGACERGHYDIVKLLVAGGADVNRPNISGGNPLHSASLEGNENIIKLLIEAGADVNQTNSENGWTPLHAAIGGGHCHIVKLLLAGGVNEDSLFSEYAENSNHHGPPIHFACKIDSSVEMIRLFVEHNLGFNMLMHRDERKRLPLQCFDDCDRDGESFRYLQKRLQEEKSNRLITLELAIWKVRCISQGIALDSSSSSSLQHQHQHQQEHLGQRKRKRSEASPHCSDAAKKIECLTKSGSHTIIPLVVEFLGEGEFGLIEEKQSSDGKDSVVKEGGGGGPADGYEGWFSDFALSDDEVSLPYSESSDDLDLLSEEPVDD